MKPWTWHSNAGVMTVTNIGALTRYWAVWFYEESIAYILLLIM